MIKQTTTVVSHAMRESGTAPLFCGTLMPPALTPELALDYVRELSADVRAALVLDARGALLAGPFELAEPARALLGAGGEAAEIEVAAAGGVVCAVRSSAHAALAVCGRFAIGGVVREDLRAALAALEGRSPEAPAGPARPARDATPDPALIRAAEALISAVQRASGA
jgi:hypothetical protein